MDDSSEKTLFNNIEELRKNPIKTRKTLRALNWVGYGFLVFFLTDVVTILLPPNFGNPVWEFGVFRNLVERVTLPLIGFGLVFVGDYSLRSRGEILTLRVLSYLALILGFAYFILMIFGISSTVQIDRQNNEKITQEGNDTRTKLELAEQVFQSVKTIEQMEVFLSRFDSQGRTPNIKDDREFQVAKQRFSEFLEKGKKQLKAKIQEARSTQRKNLLKNSLKWNLRALLSGVLFVILWRGTTEVRRYN
ncbi:HpsJ family protein [Altericista sp. CCNU0014]|uniref:HpsJ-like protein, cyanoexosortase A-associated n=1 Tax=Altericista sp. CCNU0014 TaxID=3082949 RepID=UPI00384D52E1